ncbi:sporulation protein YqfD [Bacillus sp. AFS053548]|uniref:sporulation protein YqfD n=1 Tax=Bacillus sp. AFS053548 TaxID=2033505 RepID=UPI000BFCE79D|nr:sporulation protein YqfD [Bacillus sp. AFS053548]PGM57088.1 sporulation protein YqfD [Bacillus sp. AFS053548]
MKNQWTSNLTGMVQVKVIGLGPERFLNDCMRKGIPLRDVKKSGTNSITFTIELKDYKRIKNIPRKKEYKVYFIGRKGLPFEVRRAWKYFGFVVGVVGFLVVLFLLSNMVWRIDIKGASPEVEYKLRKDLTAMGVKTGASQFTLPRMQTIQKKLQDDNPTLTWIGVQLNGTTFHFEVVEKHIPKPEKALSPRHIIASEEAVISSMFVEKGKPLVVKNDFVKKGQILVSGIIGTEEHPILVPAVGKIMGEVWREEIISVPLDTPFTVLTGERKTSYYIGTKENKIKFWGFDKNKYKSFEDESSTYQFKFLKWKLPIFFSEKTILESEKYVRTYSKVQAAQLGKQIGKKELMKKLSPDAKILQEKVLHESIDNGKVNLRMYYKVLEDITKTKTIVQGD